MTNLYSLSIHAGETRTLIVTVTDQSGAAIDLTGASITYIANLPTPITKMVGSGITITAPLLGRFEIALTQADTVAINQSLRAQHEAKILTAGGAVLVAFVGSLSVGDSLIGVLS